MSKKAPLKILFVAAEMSPLLSTGGLAEVAAAQPRFLRALGHDVRVAMPCYRSVPAEHRGEEYCLCEAKFGAEKAYGAFRKSVAPDSDVPLYLVEHAGYFGREKPYGVGAYEFDDNAERFCFFSHALLHGVAQTGWTPDVVHCHDWHTAAIPTLLKTRLAKHPVWGGMPCVYTIHNLAFQGRYKAEHFASTGLDPWLLSPDYLEYEGDMNLMKGAIQFATKVNTVSPRYAQEIRTLEYGNGLDGVLRERGSDLSGILNGVDYDVWNPQKDRYTAADYSAKDLSGKALCKAALQETFGLPKSDVPLFGMVSRLFWQKGVDLLAHAIDALAEMDLQIAVLGTGDPEIERRLSEATARHPEKVGVALKFDAPLSHQIEAGADFFLMPSRYEPCGLGQMYSMAYGTIPVVRRTGGLADTVHDLNPVHERRETATGISFPPFTEPALIRSVERATALYEDKASLNRLRLRCMTQDFSWNRSAEAYVALYREAVDAG